RETALFFVDWLVPDPRSGKLVSGPTASPENRFKVNGKVASLTMGCTYDQEIIWNTFRDFLEACKILGISNEETVEVEASMKKLSMPTIA
ncbi:UNVERIFIED_CONTAM: glycoside hydrolase family 95 protein, partial [Bacteroidetes bacterium 56_B9]